MVSFTLPHPCALRSLPARSPADGGGGDVVEACRKLLLAYLADHSRALNPAALSARHFFLAQAFAEEVTALRRGGGEWEGEAEAVLLRYRQEREDLDGVAFRAVALEPADAARLMRAAIQVGRWAGGCAPAPGADGH